MADGTAVVTVITVVAVAVVLTTVVVTIIERRGGPKQDVATVDRSRDKDQENCDHY